MAACGARAAIDAGDRLAQFHLGTNGDAAPPPSGHGGRLDWPPGGLDPGARSTGRAHLFHQLIAEAGDERLRPLDRTDLRIPRIGGYLGGARPPGPWSIREIGHGRAT